jgi:shikimate kinase
MEAAQLTQSEFDAHLKNKTLRLGFIGMSNAGKSYRARILQKESGFMSYHVDDQIQTSLGFTTVEELAHWLGYPGSPTYKAREADYLVREARYTKVDFLDTQGKNLVFDTTGSVIYLDSAIQDWLKGNCLLVHFDAGEDALGAMIEKFFDHPKPVIWGSAYQPAAGESERDTLKRCYPKLLSDRLAKYRALAHLNIPAKEVRDKSGQETLAIIRSYLPA